MEIDDLMTSRGDIENLNMNLETSKNDL